MIEDNSNSANDQNLDSKSLVNENVYSKDMLPNGSFDITVEFLQKVTDMMFAYINKSVDRKEKILNFYHPDELKSKISLDIGAQPLPLHRIIDDCQAAFDYSVRAAHPRFFNQLSQGLDMVSLAGELVTNAINSNMFTYEVSPFFNLVEEVIFEKMSNIIGWENCDGIFSPGGSISNLYALLVARHHFFSETKVKGLYNMPKLIVYTSEHSHYSIHRAVCIGGLGLENIRNVPVDESGKMRPDKLEEMIQMSLENNEKPFLVALTSGTTVLGAFDPIEECSVICKKYNLWLHVDAAWGGGCLLSSKHKSLMRGVEKADSVTWNPHKLMGASLQCSAFLVKKKGLLLDCNEMNATYLFQQDKHYDIKYDTGDKTIQCGRHVDVFKLWLMWRSKGEDGFENQIDKLLDLARLCYEELKKRTNFKIVLENPEFTNICFWYVPKSLEDMDRSSVEFKNKLNSVAPRIKGRMMQNGSLMVGYQPLDDKPNFFRAVFSNNATVKEDVLFMIDEIERLGNDL